jgi:hypothetical protein
MNTCKLLPFILLCVSMTRADISVTAVGDIAVGVIGTPYYVDTILNPVKQHLKADVVFGNLEGVISDKHLQTTKRGKNTFSFRMPTKYASILKDAGFNVLNFNNNHSNDFNYTGKMHTKAALAKNGIGYLDSVLVVNDSICFYSFYLHSSSRCITWTDSIQQIIKDLAQRYPILIISIHGGKEGSSVVTNTCERYLGEYRGNLVEFSEASIDAGADLVLCHGPHVIRDVDVYKGRLIAYSLGNFCTPFGFKLTGPFGESLILKVILNDDGALKSFSTIKLKQIRNEGFQVESF